MKFGPRKPSISRRVKARTTGKVKRKAKRAINPTYGKKGTGWAKNPKRAAYSKAYNKTTTGCAIPFFLLGAGAIKLIFNIFV